MFKKNNKTNRERKKNKKKSKKNYNIYSNKHIRIKNKLIKNNSSHKTFL